MLWSSCFGYPAASLVSIHRSCQPYLCPFSHSVLLSSLSLPYLCPSLPLLCFIAPLIDEDRWNPYIAVVNPILALPLCAFAFGAEMDLLTTAVLFGIGFSTSVLLAIHFSCLGDTAFDPPSGVLESVFLVFGFVMSIVWVIMVAGFLVDEVNAVGMIIGLSEQILGITILALGNSLPDLFSGIALARDGYPLMAVGGVYAAPFYNISIGVGFALLMKASMRCVCFRVVCMLCTF
jgi:sodium/potassium/calcium exchanger 6